MKLNSEIINDFLSEHMLIRSFGKGTEALRLCRPKIYTGESNEFLPDHLYVALVDQLPPDPILHRGTVMSVWVGNRFLSMQPGPASVWRFWIPRIFLPCLTGFRIFMTIWINGKKD